MKKPKDLRRALHKKRMMRGVAKAEKERQDPNNLRDPNGRYNGYICDKRGGCGGIYLTVDLDPGVTPMFMPCLITENCEGMAVSMGYPVTLPPMKVALLVEWYKPQESVIQQMPKAMIAHVRKGGLLRRPTKDAPEWVKEQLGPVFPREGESHHQLTLLHQFQGDKNGRAQEPGNLLHHAGSAEGSAKGAVPGDPGQGETPS